MHRALFAFANLVLLTSFSALAPDAKAKEKPQAVTIPAGVDHARWTELLKKYVNDRGLVAYADWKANGADMKALEEYLEQFAPKPEHPAKGDELMASAINAYNAFAIHWILEKYPTDSIQEFRDSFTAKRNEIGGEKASLDDIEQGTVRPEIKWRAHAVLVCCARSCPPLQRTAYGKDKLQEQIEAAYRAWLGREDLNQFLLNDKKAKISSIFKWFQEDFDSEGGVKRVLARFGPDKYHDFLQKGDYEIDYLPYHWGLNDQGGKGKDYGRLDLIWDKITGTFAPSGDDKK